MKLPDMIFSFFFIEFSVIMEPVKKVYEVKINMEKIDVEVKVTCDDSILPLSIIVNKSRDEKVEKCLNKVFKKTNKAIVEMQVFQECLGLVLLYPHALKNMLRIPMNDQAIITSKEQRVSFLFSVASGNNSPTDIWQVGMVSIFITPDNSTIYGLERNVSVDNHSYHLIQFDKIIMDVKIEEFRNNIQREIDSSNMNQDYKEHIIHVSYEFNDEVTVIHVFYNRYLKTDKQKRDVVKQLSRYLDGEKPKKKAGKNEKESDEACEDVEEPKEEVEVEDKKERNTWKEFIIL